MLEYCAVHRSSKHGVNARLTFTWRTTDLCHNWQSVLDTSHTHTYLNEGMNFTFIHTYTNKPAQWHKQLVLLLLVEDDGCDSGPSFNPRDMQFEFFRFLLHLM